MTSLLVLKEYLKKFYSNYEVYIMPVLKLFLAGVSLLMINTNLGYMDRINSGAIVLIVALMCSFLPMGFILFFAALFILLHLYALALEVAVVALALFLVMFLLYFRFSPKDTLVVLLTPICFLLKIPYIMPIAVGLICTPASAISVACGTVIYYLVSYVSKNATTLNAMDAGEATARFRMVIDSILGNKEMMVTVAAFVITVIVVYVVRRMSMDHSWTIAMVAGAITNVVILLMGDLLYDTNVLVVGVIFGSVVSVFIAKVLQFFVLNLDYSRTEKVQFEDDEYYYYVKAVPKITVSTPTKTVKRINTQRHSVSSSQNRNVSKTGENRSANTERYNGNTRSSVAPNSKERPTVTRESLRETNWER